jgi:hypothetical protein
VVWAGHRGSNQTIHSHVRESLLPVAASVLRPNCFVQFREWGGEHVDYTCRWCLPATAGLVGLEFGWGGPPKRRHYYAPPKARDIQAAQGVIG